MIPSSSISRQMSLILDIVRFAAACLVLLHHAAFEKFGTYVPRRFTETATEPVMAFFVLSGFVIALTAEVNDTTASQYAVSRATRLLSVVLPALLLTAVLDKLGSSLFPALYLDHWSDAATLANLATPLPVQIGASATFLNEIWNVHVWPGTNSPFWSLGYEAAYYVLFGIAFYERREWPRAFGLVLVCLIVGPKVLLLLPVWLMGVAVWHVYRRATITPPAGAALCAAATLAYAAFMASGARGALDAWSEALVAGVPANLVGLSSHFLSAYVSGLLFAATLFGLKGLEGMLAPALAVSAPWIRAAAHCTFSMYLFHYPLIHFFRAAGAVWYGQRDLAARSWPLTATVVAGTAVSICVLARFTEQRKAEFRAMIVAALLALRPSKTA